MCYKISQSQFGTLCHQVAELCEGSPLSAPTKMHVFLIIKNQMNMNPTPISFDDATKQISRSHNLTTLLENIGNPAWYVLLSGGTTACRKWRVCTDLKNARVFV